MEIFRGYTIKTGVGSNGIAKYIDIPVSYGSRDRVTAAIVNNNTQNLPLRLPVMVAYMQGLTLATEKFKGNNTVRKVSYVPRGHSFPDDIQTVVQIMPVPYNITMNLTIYTSNFDSHLQILEQILVLFNPSVQIQVSDGDFDMGKITTVTLNGIVVEENFPVGTASRMCITTLSFNVVAYLTVPAQVRDDVIKDIYVRIGTVTNLADEQDILAELDSQLDQYILTVSAKDVVQTITT